MPSLLWRPRLGATIRLSAHARYGVKTSKHILTTPQLRAFQSSTKGMGAGLAHAPMQQDAPDLVYDIYDEKPREPFVRLEQSRAPGPRPTPRAHEIVEDSAIMEGKKDYTEMTTAKIPAYFHSSKFDRVPYWQKIGRWKDVGENDFLSYRWNVS